MLQLKKIVKDYQTGDEVVKALKGISINFRKNEFVSVLGGRRDLPAAENPRNGTAHPHRGSLSIEPYAG